MRTYSFNVKDKEYKLKYTFNSICDLEEESGMGLTSMFSNNKVGLNTMRLVIWAGLRWQDRGITKQRVGEVLQSFIDEGGDYSQLCSEAAQLISYSVAGETEKKREE